MVSVDPSTTTLTSSLHDSPDKPLPSSSHDHSATILSSVHDLPTNTAATISNPSPTSNVCVSPGTNAHPSATPPSIVQESPVIEPSSCDLPATPPQGTTSPHQDRPISPTLNEHTSPLLTISSHDQLQFNDQDIINTQLNHQISEVKNFLKADNLKLTKPKPRTQIYQPIK